MPNKNNQFKLAFHWTEGELCKYWIINRCLLWLNDLTSKLRYLYENFLFGTRVGKNSVQLNLCLTVSGVTTTMQSYLPEPARSNALINWPPLPPNSRTGWGFALREPQMQGNPHPPWALFFWGGGRGGTFSKITFLGGTWSKIMWNCHTCGANICSK